MTTTPPETDGPLPPEPGETGPRVTRDEARDLGRIRRSRTDRKIAGVAGGVARHFDVDPLLVRVGFVLLTFFGGGGILAYVAGWLLIPEEGSEDAAVRTDDRTRTVILTLAAALCGLSLLGDAFGSWDFPWPLAILGLIAVAVISRKGHGRGHRPGHGHRMHGWHGSGDPEERPSVEEHDEGEPPSYVGYRPPRPSRPRDPSRRGPLLFWFTLALAALAVGVVGTVDLAGVDVPPAAYPGTVLATYGLMLLVGAFYGRAGGLIFVGLVATLATAVATVVDDVSAGRVSHTPLSAAAVDESYELGIGEIYLDLRQVEDPENLAGETIDIDLQVGHVEVILPDPGVPVVVDADIGTAGEAKVLGERRDGSLSGRFDGGTGVDEGVEPLVINVELDLGEIEVYTEEAAA